MPLILTILATGLRRPCRNM